MMLAGDVIYSISTNPFDSEDVNRDGTVSPLDVLAVINALGARGGAAQSEGTLRDGQTLVLDVDVNEDGSLSPIDALRVINQLQPEAEGTQKAAYTPITLSPNSVRGSRNLFFDYIDNGTTDQVQRSAGSWITDGFSAGDQILITDSGQYVDINVGLVIGQDENQQDIIGTSDADIRVHNNGVFTIQSLTATTLTLTSDLMTTFPARARLDGDLVEGENLFDNSATFFKVVDQVSPGGTFLLGTLFEDLRMVGDTGNTLADVRKGPFSAYVDVVFDNTLATPNGTSVGDISFANGFTSQTFGSFSTPGLIDEAGGVAFSTPGFAPTGAGKQLIWTTPFTAGSTTGPVTFSTNAADATTSRDTLLFSSDLVVLESEIMFNTGTINIASDVNAVADTAMVDENGGPTFINVLQNDSITVGSGPTITSPIPTTSAQGGTVAQSGANGFNYTPPSGFNGTDTFSYTITNGTTTASATVTVTVNPVDDRPVIAGPSSLNTNEDTTFTLSGFTITDPDSTNITVTLSANGTLSQTTFSGTPAQVTSTLNSITYTPVANSTAADTLSISANDGGLTGTKSVSITINSINDPPVNTINGLGNPPAQAVANTGTHTFPSGTFVVTDADPADTVSVTVSVLHGTLSNGSTTGASLSFSGSSTVNIGNLVYDPTDNYVGDDTLTITSTDGSATDTDTVAITVAPPQFPFAAANTYQANEGTGSFTLSPNPLDNDLKDDGATLSVTAISPNAAPTATSGMLAFSSGIFTYTPPTNPDFFGTETFTYTIEQDAAHTPSSTGNTESTGQIIIVIAPVNDAPTSTVPGAQTVSEDPQSPLAITGISVADIDGDNLTVTLSVSNGTLNSVAPIARSGSSLTLTGTVANLSTALAGLTYSPNSNYNGSDSLVVGVNDGTAPTVSKSVAITVTAQNDDPTISVPGAQQFFRDVSNSLSSAITIADIDAGSGNVRVNLTIGAGTLAVTSSNGTQVAQITNGISVTGSVANVNSALASLTYTSSVSGNFTLTAAVNDLGNTGTGGGQDVTGTVAVEVLDFVPTVINGEVYNDLNEDGNRDSGEGVGGITVTLTGTDFRGNSVNLQTTTNADGTYSFMDVAPNQTGSPYTITRSGSSFLQGSGGTAQVNLDLQGNQTVTGSLGGAVTFTDAGAEVYKLYSLSGTETSGVLFGADGSGSFSMLEGEWAGGRYTNVRFVATADGSSGTLTVYDTQLGVDRVANVSGAGGTLTFRGTGSARVYRVVGTPSALLSAANAEGEAENNALTSGSAFARGVDSIFANGGV